MSVRQNADSKHKQAVNKLQTSATQAPPHAHKKTGLLWSISHSKHPQTQISTKSVGRVTTVLAEFIQFVHCVIYTVSLKVGR